MQINDRVRELRRVKASDLKPHPKNWRTHPKEQREALQGLLAEIGYADALIARELPDGTLELIDGHLRAETTPDQDVPVLVLDVTEQEAEKLLTTLDPLAAMAGADRTKLRALLGTLETKSAGVRDLLQELGAKHGVVPELSSIVETEVPAPPDAATTVRGDIIVLGDHKLMCGDAGSVEDLDRLLAGEPVHLVNTDPVYNVKVEPRSNNAIAAGLSSFGGGTHHQRFDAERNPDSRAPTDSKLRAKDRPLLNDSVTDEAFDKLLLAWFGNLGRVLVPGGSFYIWGGYANLANYPAALKASGLNFAQGIVWNKLHPVLTRKDFMGAFEFCFYGWKLGAGHHFYGPNNVTDLWEVKKVNPQNMIHLTEKPVELAVRAIVYSSKKGDNVLDVFGGSGSTLMGAEHTGRRAFLMELDALYCDVIVNRWETATGRRSIRQPLNGAQAA
jgi:DNA modification methylase